MMFRRAVKSWWHSRSVWQDFGTQNYNAHAGGQSNEQLSQAESSNCRKSVELMHRQGNTATLASNSLERFFFFTVVPASIVAIIELEKFLFVR